METTNNFGTNNNIEKKKRKDIVVAVILVLLIFVSGFYFLSTRTLKNELTEEQKRTTTLVSEKSKLENDVKILRQEVESLTGNNAQLNKVVEATQQKLAEQEKQIKGLKNEKAAIAKQREELRKTKESLIKELAQLGINYRLVIKQNDSLNMAIDKMREEIEKLRLENAQMQTKMADNISVETLAKNGKPMVNARRVKTIKASLDVAKATEGEIYCVLMLPGGKTISSKDSKDMVVSISDIKDGTKNTGIGTGIKKHIDCKITVQTKLNAGIYFVEFYNQTTLIKSVSFKLR